MTAGPAGTAPAIDEPTGCETVLLVEDYAPVRQLAQRLLERRGYRVLPAASGAEAMQLVMAEGSGGPIDVLLTDVVMPEVGGRMLAHRLTANRPRLPVVYMSAFPERYIVEEGLLDAGVRLVQKPFTETALAQALRSALDTRLSVAHAAGSRI